MIYGYGSATSISNKLPRQNMAFRKTSAIIKLYFIIQITCLNITCILQSITPQYRHICVLYHIAIKKYISIAMKMWAVNCPDVSLAPVR
jgi:hypothetical protein